MHQFKAELKMLSSQVWACGIFVPNDISDTLLKDGHKRVICTLNKTESYQCALLPNGDQEYFVNVNKDLQKKLRIQVGDTVLVQLIPDESQYGLPVPDELAELFVQDEEGKRIFHTLTLGKQRTLLHLIAKPKSGEIRLHKAIVVIEYLKEVNGRLDFKELNLAIKTGNQRF